MKTKMINLQRFKEFLQERNLDFMVVGSMALKVCGMELSHEPEDIDMEVICTKEQEDVFKILCAVQGNTFYKLPEIYPQEDKWEHKPYIFMFRDEKINVWCVKEFTHKTFVWKDHIKYAGVMSVLKAKMRYKRPKDYKDLMFIVKTLVDL